MANIFALINFAKFPQIFKFRAKYFARKIIKNRNFNYITKNYILLAIFCVVKRFSRISGSKVINFLKSEEIRTIFFEKSADFSRKLLISAKISSLDKIIFLLPKDFKVPYDPVKFQRNRIIFHHFSRGGHFCPPPRPI